MEAMKRLAIGLAALFLTGLPIASAQSSRVVLFEDPTLSAERIHAPLFISSEGRGYRIQCKSQEDEEAIIRGPGLLRLFPSQVFFGCRRGNYRGRSYG